MSADPLFGAGWGNYAIQGIVELTVPDAVSMLPQTPGWWLLLGLVVFAAFAMARKRRERWLRDRYRRDALEELAVIRKRLASGETEALRELAPLLRATALVAGDRASLTTLRGQAWADAINAMAPGLNPVPVAHIEQLAYGPLTAESARNSDQLLDAIDAWIGTHEVGRA